MDKGNERRHDPATGRFTPGPLRACATCGGELNHQGRNRSYCGATCRTAMRSSDGKSRWWTPEEDRILREIYPSRKSLRQVLAALPGRTEHSVRAQARKLSLERLPVTSKRGNLGKLLEQTPEAAYWIGLIAADGCLTAGHRLLVSLAARDGAHLQKLIDFLGCKAEAIPSKAGSMRSFALVDRANGRALAERFGLHPQKTYNPPPGLPYEDVSLLRSFLIGFIDGDGHIAKQYGRSTSAITTVSHLSWEPLLTDLAAAVDFGYVKRRGPEGKRYAMLASYRHDENVALKNFANQSGLPILSRKWSKIDASIVADRYSRAGVLRGLIMSGLMTSEIVSTGFSARSVYQMRSTMRAAGELIPRIDSRWAERAAQSGDQG